jgi:hypothetical protein
MLRLILTVVAVIAIFKNMDKIKDLWSDMKAKFKKRVNKIEV